MDTLDKNKVFEEIKKLTGSDKVLMDNGEKENKKKRKRQNNHKKQNKKKKKKNWLKIKRNMNIDKEMVKQWELPKQREICKFFFLKGKCLHEDNCLFSHDVTPIYKISKLCKFLIHGNCKNENCIFSHDYNLFYCRNNIIFHHCNNPSCKFKHVPFEDCSTELEKNAKIDQYLSKDDKIRFLYNNKYYLISLYINKYYKSEESSPESKEEEINIESLEKKSEYPWYIKEVIDLLKIDIKNNKAYKFQEILYSSKNKIKNLINYMDEDQVKMLQATEDIYKKNEKDQDKEEEHKIKDNNFNDVKFYSSDEDEDYTKYLNKYFEVQA